MAICASLFRELKPTLLLFFFQIKLLMEFGDNGGLGHLVQENVTRVLGHVQEDVMHLHLHLEEKVAVDQRLIRRNAY